MLARLDDDGLDTGPRSLGPVTERLCLATRTVKPIGEMIRFVVAPDGTLVPDLRRKLPGRGIWITATREALVQALKRKAIGASFKRAVRVDPALAELTERLLEQSALDALSICAKGSLARTGFARAEAALMREPVVALLHAADAGVDGVKKLNAALRRKFEAESERVRIVTEFTSDQLDLALGRPNVIHAALLKGSASETFLARHARLIGFRTGNPAVAGDQRRRPEGTENKERNV
jgi:predicted RNA-binding protein YlxR (DUF448 family)